jgi:hypothetical protein
VDLSACQILPVLRLKVIVVTGAHGAAFIATPFHEIPVVQPRKATVTHGGHIETQSGQAVGDARRKMLVQQELRRHD